MKLTYIGATTIVPENYLYNCTRNPACQREYYMPLQTFDNLILFMDFPFGSPASVSFYAKDCDTIETQLVYTNYVIAQRPDESWYGVFTGWTTDIADIGSRFYIVGTATTSTLDFHYITNQFEHSSCDRLMKLSSCYNDTEITSDATDCNGIYYGFPATDSVLGNPLLRYYHNAYVRNGSVLETKNKMQFSFFNSSSAYRNTFSKNYSLRFELVPSFYKDILIGVFNRGNIQINDVDYRLDDSQEIDLADEDLQFWQMDMTLTNICNQTFSCKPTICQPAAFHVEPPTCNDNFTTVSYTGEDEGFYTFQLSNGTLDDGDDIEWQILQGQTVVDSGTTQTSSIYSSASIDPTTECYTLKWRKYCAAGDNYTDYNTSTFGDCTSHDPGILFESNPVCRITGSCNDNSTCGMRFTVEVENAPAGSYVAVSGQTGSATVTVSDSDPANPALDYSEPNGAGTVTFNLLLMASDHTTVLAQQDNVTISHQSFWTNIASCSPPKVTSVAVTPYDYNGGTQYYQQVWATIQLDKAVDVDTSFDVHYDYQWGFGDFPDTSVTVVVSAGQSQGETYKPEANDLVSGACVFSCDNTDVDLNGHAC